MTRYAQVIDLMAWFQDPEAFGCIAFQGWRSDLVTREQHGRYALLLGIDVLPF